MASRRTTVSIPEELAARLEQAGIGFSELLAEAAEERLGDRKTRPLGKRIFEVERQLAQLRRSQARLEKLVFATIERQ